MNNTLFTPRSTTLHRVDYEPAGKVMQIEFRSGNVYRYLDVPQRLWAIFKLYVQCDGSPGAFFNEYIKGQFLSEKLIAA